MNQYIRYWTSGDRVKLGDFILIEGNPAKILNIKRFRTSWEEPAKTKITAIDIFNNKAYTFIGYKTRDTIAVIDVTQTEYILVDIDNETLIVFDNIYNIINFSFLCPDGNLKNKISQDFASGKDITVTIISAIGTHQVIDSKISKE
jgi:translation elongation factor P/translation initiation factor 5A